MGTYEDLLKREDELCAEYKTIAQFAIDNKGKVTRLLKVVSMVKDATAHEEKLRREIKEAFTNDSKEYQDLKAYWIAHVMVTAKECHDQIGLAGIMVGK